MARRGRRLLPGGLGAFVDRHRRAVQAFDDGAQDGEQIDGSRRLEGGRGHDLHSTTVTSYNQTVLTDERSSVSTAVPYSEGSALDWRAPAPDPQRPESGL